MFVHFLEGLVEVLRHLDVLKHPGQLVDIVSWHSYFLLGHVTSQWWKTPPSSNSIFIFGNSFLMQHQNKVKANSWCYPLSYCTAHPLRSYPEPLHHVLLDLAVCWDVQDEPTGKVGFVVAHEHVFVLDILQHQQLQTLKIKWGLFAAAVCLWLCD